jgi:hypothetical protein
MPNNRRNMVNPFLEDVTSPTESYSQTQARLQAHEQRQALRDYQRQAEQEYRRHFEAHRAMVNGVFMGGTQDPSSIPLAPQHFDDILGMWTSEAIDNTLSGQEKRRKRRRCSDIYEHLSEIANNLHYLNISKLAIKHEDYLLLLENNPDKGPLKCAGITLVSEKEQGNHNWEKYFTEVVEVKE